MNNVENRSSVLKAFNRLAFAVAGLAILVAGCSTDPVQEDGKTAYRAPVYRTGSNIPVGRESSDSDSSSSGSSSTDMQTMMPATRPNCGGARSCS